MKDCLLGGGDVVDVTVFFIIFCEFFSILLVVVVVVFVRVLSLPHPFHSSHTVLLLPPLLHFTVFAQHRSHHRCILITVNH